MPLHSYTFIPTIPDNEGRKEVVNVLLNDALNTFYLRLYGVRHMAKDHSDSEKGNPLPLHRLLVLINSKGSLYASCHREKHHGVVIPVVEHWLEREFTDKNRCDERPFYHCLYFSIKLLIKCNHYTHSIPGNMPNLYCLMYCISSSVDMAAPYTTRHTHTAQRSRTIFVSVALGRANTKLNRTPPWLAFLFKQDTQCTCMFISRNARARVSLGDV